MAPEPGCHFRSAVRSKAFRAPARPGHRPGRAGFSAITADLQSPRRPAAIRNSTVVTCRAPCAGAPSRLTEFLCTWPALRRVAPHLEHGPLGARRVMKDLNPYVEARRE